MTGLTMNHFSKLQFCLLVVLKWTNVRIQLELLFFLCLTQQLLSLVFESFSIVSRYDHVAYLPTFWGFSAKSKSPPFFPFLGILMVTFFFLPNPEVDLSQPSKAKIVPSFGQLSISSVCVFGQSSLADAFYYLCPLLSCSDLHKNSVPYYQAVPSSRSSDRSLSKWPLQRGDVSRLVENGKTANQRELMR